MTPTPDTDGLVERLNSHMGKQDVGVLLADCRLAATRIAELEGMIGEAFDLLGGVDDAANLRGRILRHIGRPSPNPTENPMTDDLKARLIRQVEVGLFAMDNPVSYADCLARINELEAMVAQEKARWDEESEWDETVRAIGSFDQFDRMAEQWSAREPIKRTIRATTSVFSKWANDDLMRRFHEAIVGLTVIAFAEGAAAGAHALRASLKEGE